MSGDTGNQATITFPNGTVAGVFRIKPGTYTRGTIEDDDLQSEDFMELIQEDLVSVGEIEVGARFDPEADIPDIHEGPGTITVTWGSRDGQDQPANLAGSGFMTEWEWPELSNNTRQECTFKLQFDGKATKPVFTPAELTPTS